MSFDFDDLASLFETHGSSNYDEVVSLVEHMLQAADQAARAGADDELIVAALLHDIGYLLLAENGDDAAFRDQDLAHERLGEQYLRPRFGNRIATTAAMHVDAKRYLCGTDPRYLDKLSAASIRTLELQGGPFTPAEAAAFEAHEFAHDALALRRWDEAAKEANHSTPRLASYRQLLETFALDGP